MEYKTLYSKPKFRTANLIAGIFWSLTGGIFFIFDSYEDLYNIKKILLVIFGLTFTGLSLIYYETRIYKDRIESGIKYPFVKGLKKITSLSKSVFEKVVILQDTRRYYVISVKDKTGNNIAVGKIPNLNPAKKKARLLEAAINQYWA